MSSAFCLYLRTSASSFSTRALYDIQHMYAYFRGSTVHMSECSTWTFSVSISSLYILAALASPANSCLCGHQNTHSHHATHVHNSTDGHCTQLGLSPIYMYISSVQTTYICTCIYSTSAVLQRYYKGTSMVFRRYFNSTHLCSCLNFRPHNCTSLYKTRK